MLRQCLGPILALYRLVRTRLGKVELHRFAKELKVLESVDGILRGLGVFEHDESLTSALECALRDYIEDITGGFESFAEVRYEDGEFDALFEVFDLQVRKGQ